MSDQAIRIAIGIKYGKKVRQQFSIRILNRKYF